MIFEDAPVPHNAPTKGQPSSLPAVRVQVKAVPGSRRSEIVGRLGDRLKIKVAAPPEGGRANDAICRLLAQELGLRPSSVQVLAGTTTPEKVVLVLGITRAQLETRWP